MDSPCKADAFEREDRRKWFFVLSEDYEIFGQQLKTEFEVVSNNEYIFMRTVKCDFISTIGCQIQYVRSKERNIVDEKIEKCRNKNRGIPDRIFFLFE